MPCLYGKIRTRKQSAKKRIKTGKKWNPPLFGIRNPVPGIRNPQHGIQNPRLSWIPLHGATSCSDGNRQPREKCTGLYENLMSNNFCLKRLFWKKKNEL